MPKLTLGTHSLPPGEVLLIRTLMRLFSHDQAFGWKLSEEGPYDALIMDNALAPAHDPATPVGTVLRLTPGNGVPSGHTLQRPIKAEKLHEWLKNSALHLQASAAQPDRLRAMKQARFKLLRWPSTALLQNDASLIRMSSLMSRRSLQLSELAELSHQSIEFCLAFIEKLLPMKLIDCEFMAPLATASGMPMRGASVLRPAAALVRVPFHQGLIGRIRKHLGL